VVSGDASRASSGGATVSGHLKAIVREGDEVLAEGAETVAAATLELLARSVEPEQRLEPVVEREPLLQLAEELPHGDEAVTFRVDELGGGSEAKRGPAVLGVEPAIGRRSGRSPGDERLHQGGDRSVVVDGVSYVLGGDIITRADGDRVTTPEDLSSLVMAKEPGDTLALEIHRGDSQRTVDVTLGRRPSEPAG
jgi:hypothetical protein